MSLWKQLLPSAAERSRNTWTHRGNCNYLRKGARIPLSSTGQQKVVCDCGLGRGHEGTSFEDRYSSMPFFDYFFRVALAPIFPYLHNSMADELFKATAGRKGKSTSKADDGVCVENVRKSKTTSHTGPFTHLATQLEPAVAAKSEERVVKRCDKCLLVKSEETPLLRCGRCKRAYYCSRACQQSAWKEHKASCCGSASGDN